MPIQERNIVSVHQGINSFDLDQSQGVTSNENISETFISFLQSSNRFIEQIAANYSSLRKGSREGVLAYVEASQGTSWLPYTIGGTYYPKGWYVWDGADWISSKSNVAETLQALENSGGGGTGTSGGFSGDYNDLTNKPTIPVDTDTQRSDSEIQAIIDLNTNGFITVDTNTQLTDQQVKDIIATEGYITEDTNTQLNDSDIAAMGYIKTFTDTNTQLSDSDIAALGYIKTFTDTNTQLTDQQVKDIIATEGYITTDTNTQLTDSDIAAFGYVKTDNDTQRTDQEIKDVIATEGYSTFSGSYNDLTDAPAAGGTTIEFFQASDDGSTGQLTTGTFAVVSGIWQTPSIIDSAAFTFNTSTGLLTVSKEGVIEFDTKLVTYNNANNRHELHIQIQKNSNTVLTADAQYSSRNNAQRIGGAYIMGFKDNCQVGDTYRIRTKDVGVAATIGASQIAGMSYFSAKLYS